MIDRTCLHIHRRRTDHLQGAGSDDHIRLHTCIYDDTGFIDPRFCHPSGKTEDRSRSINIYCPRPIACSFSSELKRPRNSPAGSFQSSSIVVLGQTDRLLIDHQKEVKQSAVWSAAEEASSLQGECVWRPSYVVITMRQSVDSRSTRFFTRQLL